MPSNEFEEILQSIPLDEVIYNRSHQRGTLENIYENIEVVSRKAKTTVVSLIVFFSCCQQMDDDSSQVFKS